MGLVKLQLTIDLFSIVNKLLCWISYLCFSYLFNLSHRDNFLILQTLVASIAYYMFPFLQHLPLWNSKGLIVALLLHVGLSEPLYYWVHRRFHGEYLFTHYHSLHHSSPVPESFTGENHRYPILILILSVLFWLAQTTTRPIIILVG